MVQQLNNSLRQSLWGGIPQASIPSQSVHLAVGSSCCVLVSGHLPGATGPQALWLIARFWPLAGAPAISPTELTLELPGQLPPKLSALNVLLNTRDPHYTPQTATEQHPQTPQSTAVPTGWSFLHSLYKSSTQDTAPQDILIPELEGHGCEGWAVGG